MPKSSASMFSGVIVAALMTTKGALARADSACRVRARSSLPEPGAPVTRMRAFVGATRSTVCRSWFTAGEWPTIRLAWTERARRSLTSRLKRAAGDTHGPAGLERLLPPGVRAGLAPRDAGPDGAAPRDHHHRQVRRL